MATATQTIVDTLNALLRGELAAVETYRQAEARFEGQPHVDELRRIGLDHQQAAGRLRQHVEQHGGPPAEHSGLWGNFAALVEGAARVLGKTAALKALKEGEEQGIDDYETALDNPELPAECHRLIETLLPRCRAHIRALERLLEV